MTAWEAETARTASALVELCRARPGPVDLDVALTARAAVLDGVALVLGDLVPRVREQRGPRSRPIPMRLVECDPIAAFGDVILRRVQPSVTRSPSELLDAANRTGTVTDLWAAAGRQALIEARTWRGPDTRDIDGATAWRELADVAAIAETIAVLDLDLAAVKGRVRSAVSRIVEPTAGLRVAARATLVLAEASATDRGVHPDDRGRSTPAQAPTPHRPRRPEAPELSAPSLARQVRRLATIVDGAENLSPRHVRLAAKVVRNLGIVAARSAAAPDGTDLRTELGDLVHALHAVTQADHGEVALTSAAHPVLDLQLRDLYGQVPGRGV